MEAPEGYVLENGLATGLPEDLVHEVAGVLEWYGCDQGRLTKDAAAHAILAARAWSERQAAERRGHERRREEAARETGRLLDLAEARRRAREYVSADGDPVRAGRAMQARGSRLS
jgi:hypothetical protein